MSPGSRHPKRYLDVEELLNCGINVYTTVNIQHIESLNDVVAQITGVRVRETVPDSILDRADAIELVDITPGDLIQRLKEGKVYVPKQAERALEHFFSPANLTALRELALRRTAERVDEQLLDRNAGARDSGSLGRRRAPARLRQRRSARGGARALHQAPRRPPACVLDGALCRDQAQPATDRGGARPHRRHASAGAGLGRRAGHHSRRRPPHRRRRGRLCAGKQHHADHHRQIHAVAPGSSSCMARWCAICCAAAAISACMSSPARTGQGDHPEKDRSHRRPA